MRTVLLAATALAAILSAPAQGQSTSGSAAAATDESDDQSVLGDIVVTAQRREQSVQDVPIAISAFSADQLRAQGVSNTLDIGQFVPNLIAQNNTGLGSANAYYIRGLGNTETIPTFDPPVGTYVDDIYLSRQNANNLTLFDVERVEVLRGPQGTLFGRNTTGGAINVILRTARLRQGRRLCRGRLWQLRQEAGARLGRSAACRQLRDQGQRLLAGRRRLCEEHHHRRACQRRRRLGRATRPARSAAIRRPGGTPAMRYIEANGENLLNFGLQSRGTDAVRRPLHSRPACARANSFAVSPYLAARRSPGARRSYGLGNHTQTNLITSNLQQDIAPDTTLTLITGYVDQKQQYALDFSDGRGAAEPGHPDPAGRRLHPRRLRHPERRSHQPVQPGSEAERQADERHDRLRRRHLLHPREQFHRFRRRLLTIVGGGAVARRPDAAQHDGGVSPAMPRPTSTSTA